MEGELVWEYINPVTAEGEIVDSIIDAPPYVQPGIQGTQVWW